MLSTNKVVHVENTFCYRDYMCQVSKTTTSGPRSPAPGPHKILTTLN